MRVFVFSLLIWPVMAWAHDYGLPNNTGTKLMSQISADGAIKVLVGHIHTRPDGQDLVLKLELTGMGFEKEIWVWDEAQQRSHFAAFVTEDSEVLSSGSRALWMGNPAPGVENVLLKVANVSVIAPDGHRVTPHGFSIYIKTNNTQFENRHIRVYR